MKPTPKEGLIGYAETIVKRYGASVSAHELVIHRRKRKRRNKKLRLRELTLLVKRLVAEADARNCPDVNYIS
jgi:hypothetical protein